MTVDFITFCCPKDIHKLHEPGYLKAITTSHQFAFDNILVVHQRCQGMEYIPFKPFGIPIWTLESESYPDILKEHGMSEDDPGAASLSSGPNSAHWWVNHTINHLIGLKESHADYIVFSDCDCTIKESDPTRSWIEEGIYLLQRHPDILIVSPGDGGQMAERRIDGARLTQNVSQQTFLCHRHTFRHVDFNIPWNWEVLAPGGPMREYYAMLEGRIWRWMHKHNLWRAILTDKWRYWHWQWH